MSGTRKKLDLVAPSVFQSRLGRRLVILMLAVSTALSIVSTAVQLHSIYDRETRDAYAVFDRIEDALLRTLEQALWDFDFSQVETVLHGVVAMDPVHNVQLTAASGQSWNIDREMTVNRSDRKVVTLNHIHADGTQVPLGRLEITISLDGPAAAILSQFFTIFVLALAKTLMASLIMLIIFDRMIARHLNRAADEVSHPGWLHSGHGDLVLNRASHPNPDDLDRVVGAINHARAQARNSISKLEQANHELDTQNSRLADLNRALSREVDERREAEAVARRANRAKSAFLATMSHEVRTPLNAIMGFFELIERAEVPPRQKIQARTGRSAAEALLGLLTNVLETSRLEANSVTLHYKPENIAALQTDIEELLDAAAARSPHEIDTGVELGADLPDEVVIDRRRVIQVLMNLIDNALRFTIEGSVRIIIELGDTPGTFRISVRDSGCGISPDRLEGIFDRFTQVDDSITREVGGTGLGLSICRQLAGLMHGEITVKSELERGSTFTLTIPTEPEAEACRLVS